MVRRRRLGDADDAGFLTEEDMDDFYRRCDEDDARMREDDHRWDEEE